MENGFKGNSFPIIIANVSICQELRTLEADFEDALLSDAITEEQVSNSPRYRSKEDSLHFLNELGWLFQRTQKSSSLSFSNFSSSRLKYLLTFSIERDWCTLIQVLLDILVERSLNDDALKQESLELLSEVDLLSQAVKRKCRKMVDLLIQYYVIQGKDATKVHLFSPSMAGPGGITPLHMAASMQDSEDLVDALTSDPQEVSFFYIVLPTVLPIYYRMNQSGKKIKLFVPILECKGSCCFFSNKYRLPCLLFLKPYRHFL